MCSSVVAYLGRVRVRGAADPQPRRAPTEGAELGDRWSELGGNLRMEQRMAPPRRSDDLV